MQKAKFARRIFLILQCHLMKAEDSSNKMCREQNVENRCGKLRFYYHATNWNWVKVMDMAQ
jgi:hypothetical protein